MISFELAAHATNATVINGEGAPATISIVTDTRLLQPGDAFLALRGEHFDGHAFLDEAARKGASVLVVDTASAFDALRATYPHVTALTVRDTLRAYMACAAAARDLFTGRVVAVTGSVGKTTTKELLAQLLAAHFGDRIAASPANENNEIGVSKFLLAHADDRYDVLVSEFGAGHYGDIDELVAIAKPHIGILTNVGEAHVGIIGSRERLAETKWGLFSGGARAVLNAQDDVSLHRAPMLKGAPHWFAATKGERISIGGRATLVLDGKTLLEFFDRDTVERAIDVRIRGLHNHTNLAAAIAGAREAGVPLDTIVQTIPHLHLPSGRYEEIRIPGAPRIIYDAYNANVSGTSAALDVFAQEAGARRILVLSSMAELGDESEALHERIGAYVAATRPGVFLAGGAFAEAMITGAVREGFPTERIVRFSTNEEAADWLRDRAHPDDVVLLKGSRAYKLEEIVEQLRRR